MALRDESVLDPHVADVHWLDEDDRHVNPMESKGIGEIGIVGTASSIAHAVSYATGIRVRELPITLVTLLQ
jgi:xanthine dehydrogenase YagR molybdenum-binding subunit